MKNKKIIIIGLAVLACLVAAFCYYPETDATEYAVLIRQAEIAKQEEARQEAAKQAEAKIAAQQAGADLAARGEQAQQNLSSQIPQGTSMLRSLGIIK